jgi:hypothetical protein
MVKLVVFAAIAAAILDAVFHIHHGWWDTSGRVHHHRGVPRSLV